MTNRTFRFYAQAFSQSGPVSVTAKFNGEQVYSGELSTVNAPAPATPTDLHGVAFEYVGHTDIVGQIPFELTVQGGTVFFGKVEANYSGFSLNINNPDSDNPTAVVAVAPEDYWNNVSKPSDISDGKTNVTINGVEQLRVLLDQTQTGPWWYTIPNNNTLACNIFVDPNIIVLAAPATVEELVELQVARQNSTAP